MWSQRLRGRKAFGKACNALTKGWKGGHIITPKVQEELLEGFRKFYDKRHWKYNLIENAIGIAYVNTIADSTSFAVINPDGTTTTVSRFCKPVNLRRDIIEACRGSAHFILNGLQFAPLFEEWVKDKDLNKLHTQVVHNDPRYTAARRAGFKTFKEPTLTEWKTFVHAKLYTSRTTVE